jgi:hypothetical protein
VALVALLGVMLLAAARPVEAQCAMCRLALASADGQKLAAALRAGILVLLVAPFGLFGVIAAAAVRSQRRIEKLRAEATEPS